MRTWLLTPTALAALMLATPACLARPAPAPQVAHGHHHAAQPVPWHSLDQDTQQMLSPLKARWDHMPAHVQQHILHKAQHWEKLPPARRQAIRERIRRWQNMTPAERRHARANQRLYHRLSPRERARLHAAYERFQHLSPAQQQRLRAQWHKLTRTQKKRWIRNGAKGDLPEPKGHPDGHGHPLPRP